MIKITSISRLMFTLLALASISVLLPAHASGQSRLESYLQRADLDSDGKIEPHEMNGTIKRYMLSKGYDINERHRIRDVVKASEEKRPSTEPTASKLKVPKFGVEATPGTGVSSFSGAAETVKYSESVTKKTRELLERYDRNGNDILDEGEIARMSWGSPRPSANDTNGDGRLTFVEIQGRYHDREVAEQRSRESARDSGRTSNGEQRGGEDRRGRGRYGRGGTPSRDTGSSSAVRGVTSSSSSGEEVSSLDRTRDYVDKYFSDRDEDGNGVLEGDELKKVSRVSKYDKNRDGKIKAEEMLAALTPKEATTSPSKYSSTSGRRTGTTSSRTKSKNKLDANGDGVIQMHEFSKEWTQKKLDEFLAKDKNGDGVLSPEQGER